MWDMFDFGFIHVILFILVAVLLYRFGTSTYDFWQKLGVKCIQPKYPFLGNIYESSFSLRSSAEVQQEFYNFIGDERFGGFYDFLTPVLMIKDPVLVDNILIKDFISFHNRGSGADLELDPLAAHLLNLDGIEWKRMRQKLSPSFSSGKLKGMQPLFLECADILLKRCKEYEMKSMPICNREFMGQFSTNVIGSCAFGLDMKKEDETLSKFHSVVKITARSNIGLKLRTAIRGKLPTLLRLLQWKNQPKHVEEFFFSFVKNAVTYREENNVQRNDFLQLLIDLRKQDLIKLNDLKHDEEKPVILDNKLMTASSYQFFAAGFATTAITLTFCLYELCVHQDVQQKVYEEIKSVVAKYDGEFSYEAVKDMKYLQQFYTEVLRRHSPAPALIRKCTADYQIPGTDIIIPKGTNVQIPVYSIQNDPQNYPEPEKFLPERFDEANKSQIKKCTYLPFGEGPRICIAARFAGVEITSGLAKLLNSYKITLNPKTKPLAYKRSGTFVEPAADIWIDLQRRQES